MRADVERRQMAELEVGHHAGRICHAIPPEIIVKTRRISQSVIVRRCAANGVVADLSGIAACGRMWVPVVCGRPRADIRARRGEGRLRASTDQTKERSLRGYNRNWSVKGCSK